MRWDTQLSLQDTRSLCFEYIDRIHGHFYWKTYISRYRQLCKSLHRLLIFADAAYISIYFCLFSRGDCQLSWFPHTSRRILLTLWALYATLCAEILRDYISFSHKEHFFHCIYDSLYAGLPSDDGRHAFHASSLFSLCCIFGISGIGGFRCFSSMAEKILL